MSVERVKNSSKSFIWMIILLVIVSAVPFFVRTLMIKFLGEEYVGLNYLFLSIVQVLSVSELGINDALVYYLYKPMADKDVHKVNGLLYLYKRLYQIIGVIVLILACCVLPFLPSLIKDEIPADINIYVLYLIYVVNMLITYFYRSYCYSVFQTNQSLYYRYKSETVINIVLYSCQIFFLISYRSYYGYAIMIPIGTIAMNTSLWYLSKKHYPQYKPEGKPEKSFYMGFKEKVSAMALMKLRNIFRNSIDSLVISSFVGLALLAKYNNYYMIMAVPVMFMNYFSQAVLQAFGNSVAVESVESNRGVIKMYSFLLQAVTMVISTGLMCLYNIFITCWIGEEYTFSTTTVILFVVYFYVLQISSISGLVRNSTGIWTKGKWIPIAETLLNLVLDIILIRYFMQDGILIGTIISLVLINIPFETTVVFREYFKEKPFKVLGDYLLNGIVAAGIVYICYLVTGLFMPVAGIVSFMVKSIVCVVISTTLFCLVHIRDSRLKDLVGIISLVLKRK